MPLQKIKFQTNIPVECALKFAEGKLCDSQFGDPQYMFTTTDDRCFFVAEKVAQKIHGLRLAPREPFDITKAEVDYGNGRKGIEWQVARVFAPGEQPDGTLAVPALPPNGNGHAQPGTGALTPAPAPTAASKPPQTNGSNGSTNGNGHAASEPAQQHFAWAQFLLSQTNALVDVYAAAVNYASTKYGNTVKAEDVRSIMLSAFINVSKNGGKCDVA